MWWIPLEIDEIDEPLTEEERYSIQVVQISQEEVAQSLDCAICLVDFVVDEDARELNCGGRHKFHQVCLFTWLEYKTTCPISAGNLSTNEEDWTEEC